MFGIAFITFSILRINFQAAKVQCGTDSQPKHQSAASEDDYVIDSQAHDPAKDQSNCQTKGCV